MKARVVVLLACTAAPVLAGLPCPLQRTTRVAVYTDRNGGIGPGSHDWTIAFWTWWAAANSDLLWVQLTNASQISHDCVLADYPALSLYVQPGGDQFVQSLALVSAAHRLDFRVRSLP